MERKGLKTSSFCNKNGPKELDSNALDRSKGLVRMRSPVQIWVAAPAQTPGIAEIPGVLLCLE